MMKDYYWLDHETIDDVSRLNNFNELLDYLDKLIGCNYNEGYHQGYDDGLRDGNNGMCNY